MPLPSADHELFLWLVNLLLDRYRPGSSARTKVTMILGAGSSIWSGLPTWNAAFKDELIAIASDVFRHPSDFIEECWRQLSPIIGLPRATTPEERRAELARKASIEDIAGVALEHAVIGARVYDLLGKTFTPHQTKGGLPPQLGYELVAHYLKHGFVDHLVTFNFDELLDEAVENELGHGEFASVASVHDITTHGRQTLPHLIKLHGTLSRPETLRFTRASTGALPPRMVALLDDVVCGVDASASHEASNDSRAAYLVSLGYGWRDPDFVHWLQARTNRVQGLLILTKKEDLERLRNTFRAFGAWADTHVRMLDVDAFCQAAQPTVTVDLLLWALTDAIESRLKKLGTPFMPAARHVVLGYLFGPNGNNARSRLNEHEPLRRFIVELVLHLAKCKGMVTLSTMSNNDRIGRYYSDVKAQYSDMARELNADLLTLVTSVGFASRFSLPSVLLESQRSLQQSKYFDVKETYYARASEPKELAAPLGTENSFSLGEARVPRYSEGLKRIVLSENGGAQDFIETQLSAVFEGPEIEVARRASDHETWTLRSAVPLHTYIDLQNRTAEVLETPWSHLLVIAESGAWLTSPSVRTSLLKQPGRRILLITADPPKGDDWPLRNRIDVDLSNTWEELGRNDVVVQSLPLSWWQHNRHMTLAFDGRDGRFVCTGGIFFRRRQKKSRIQPLFVKSEDAEDVSELVLTFLSYVRRAFEEMRVVQQEPLPAQIELLRTSIDVARAMTHPDLVQRRIVRILDALQGLVAVR